MKEHGFAYYCIGVNTVKKWLKEKEF
jgi:hypothetical protein